MRRWRYLVVALGVLALLAAGNASGAGNKSTPKVTWHHKCFAKYYFCADYPYVNGAKGKTNGFEYRVYNLRLGSSATGKEPSFTAWIWLDGKTHRACWNISMKCEDAEFYDVSVFRSKFSDPWTALTAINGGVKNPMRATVQGNLAVRFAEGIYHTPGLVIYHRGMIYLLQVGGAGGKKGFFMPRYTGRFLASIKLL